MDNGQEAGIWGGTTEQERRQLAAAAASHADVDG